MVVQQIQKMIMQIKCYTLEMQNIQQIKFYFINKNVLIEKDLKHLFKMKL